MSIQINALNVVRSVREALKRVGGGDSVTLSREEFEALANVVEAPRATPPKVKTAAPVAQQPLPLFTGEEIKLPAGLDPAHLAKLLERPKTVAGLARETRLSKGSIKRALAAMPGVEVVRTKIRAHKAGRRPFVYAMH